jgi:hypothetical protein
MLGLSIGPLAQEQNIARLWDFAFPNIRCLTISEIDKELLDAFAKCVPPVLVHKQDELHQIWDAFVSPVLRKLPHGMLVHKQDELRYQEDFKKMWELHLDPDEIKCGLLVWYPWNAPGIGTFLEAWIKKAESKDIPAIAGALSSLMNKYGPIKSLELMDTTRLGNLIASLIQTCVYTQRSIASTHAFLNSMLNHLGRHRMILIFDAVVHTLDGQDDLILSLYIFSRNIPDLDSEKEEQYLLSGLVTAVDRKLREIDADLVYWNILGNPFLQLYIQIAKYLSMHADYWEHDIYFFDHLTSIVERYIGPMNRLIWYLTGNRELYDWATSKIKVEIAGLTISPPESTFIMAEEDFLDLPEVTEILVEEI